MSTNTNTNTDTQTKQAWGYVRLSQRGRDGSIDEMMQDIREYARDRGLDLVTTRNDGNRTSGFDAEREEYQILKEAIRDGRVDAVIVRDRARLSRDFDERLRLILLFRETDTELHVIEAGGRIGLDEVQTAGFECLHAMMDHIKKMIEIERSKKAMDERPDDAYHGGIPFGMTFDENGRYLVPGDGFEDAIEAIELVEDEDVSQREASRRTGINRHTIRSILDRREWYEAAAAGIPIGNNGPIEPADP